ncbi:MAG TPA: STAS domain-containing protein [Solirubrobacterales bacterium]|jgi:anti-sigma B factor antagonist|nr:STAS domain-containing protein [Solirubrobacterales bacterium]
MSPLEITTEQREGQTLVALVGELDIASAPQFEEGLAKVEDHNPGVLVLDLRGVEFIDSTGLRAVIGADERARSTGRRFVVVRGPAAVERVFSVTQLDQRLDIVDDPDSV